MHDYLTGLVPNTLVAVLAPKLIGGASPNGVVAGMVAVQRIRHSGKKGWIDKRV